LKAERREGAPVGRTQKRGEKAAISASSYVQKTTGKRSKEIIISQMTIRCSGDGVKAVCEMDTLSFALEVSEKISFADK
jgi:hypothetical protein